MTVSCSRDDVLAVHLDGGTKTPISFNVNIGILPNPNTSGGNVSGKTKGSAQLDGTAYALAVNDLVTVGVKATPASTTSRSKSTEDVKTYKVVSTNPSTHESSLTYNGATPSDEFQWLSQSEQILLRAWSSGSTAAAPDPATYVVGTPFVLTTDQSTGYNEVLYSPQATYSYGTDGAVSIPLYHQLARVMITITEDGGSTSAKTVTLGDGTMALPKTATFADPASGHYGIWTVQNASEKEIVTPFVEQTGQTFSAVLVPGAYAAGGKLINITIGSETFSYEVPAGGITLAAGKQYNYNITVKNQTINVETVITDWNDVADAHTSYIPPTERSYFTVDDNGTQVDFAPGNLQYQASTGTWRFAENQWDYVGDGGTTGGNVSGSSNASVSSSYSGWIDLFGWGTSGHAFASGYGSAYQPWSTSTVNTDYGPTDGISGLIGTYKLGDWGVKNAIGSYPAGTWRTPTNAEWGYLFDTRPTPSGIRYAKATVNGVTGIILLPDDWSASYYALASTNTASADYTANTISASDWTSKLEAHGAVFLPAAGYRGNGTIISSVGVFGIYWSSTANGTTEAYRLTFNSTYVNPHRNLQRYDGYSVRLVRTIYEYQPPKTTVATATTAELAVGDIVCSDGTIYDPADADYVRAIHKTPIGIIAFINDGTAIGNAATEKGLGRYSVKSQGRALVFCLRNSSNAAQWRTTNTAFGTDFLGDATLNYMTETTFYPGWQRTHDMNNIEFPAAYSAYNYTGLTAPTGTTGWFLPSSGQWRLIVSNLTSFPNLYSYGAWSSNYNGSFTSQYLAAQMDAYMAPAGAYDATRLEDSTSYFYWTSSETCSSYASRIDMPSEANLGFNMLQMDRTYSLHVRPVLAF
ncbi:MAG: fimbrillin family protein [Bacteroidales bacterium]|nr:fimbrillin family protein [Bacteroidales bacterium]